MLPGSLSFSISLFLFLCFSSCVSLSLSPLGPNQSTVAGKEPIVCGAISCGSTQPRATCTSMEKKSSDSGRRERRRDRRRSRERKRITYRRVESGRAMRKRRAAIPILKKRARGEVASKPQWRQENCEFSRIVIRWGLKDRKESEIQAEVFD